MILELHPGLSGLHQIAATAEHSRFGTTTCILLQLVNDKWRAIATDGRTLLVVTGPYAAPKVADPSPEVKSVLLPADRLKVAFDCTKGPRLGVFRNGVFRVEGVPMHSYEFTAHVMDEAGKSDAGRFPYPSCLEMFKAKKEKSQAGKFDLSILQRFVAAAAGFGDCEFRSGDFAFFKDAPAELALDVDEGVQVRGLIVPMCAR